MKNIVFVLLGFAVLAAITAGGCASNKPASAKTQSVSGIVTSVNTPLQPGPDQIVIQTIHGQQTFTLRPDTEISYNNTACPIEDAGKLFSQGGNATFNCTIVYDEGLNAIAAGFWKQVQQ